MYEHGIIDFSFKEGHGAFWLADSDDALRARQAITFVTAQNILCSATLLSMMVRKLSLAIVVAMTLQCAQGQAPSCK